MSGIFIRPPVRVADSLTVRPSVCLLHSKHVSEKYSLWIRVHIIFMNALTMLIFGISNEWAAALYRTQQTCDSNL